MPSSYFRVTPPSVRTDHLKAISALKDTDMSLSVDIKSKLDDGGRLVTYIRPEDKPGLLLSQVRRLPKYEDKALTEVDIFTTSDGTMCLNSFTFSPKDKEGEGRKDGNGKVRMEEERSSDCAPCSLSLYLIFPSKPNTNQI